MKYFLLLCFFITFPLQARQTNASSSVIITLPDIAQDKILSTQGQLDVKDALSNQGRKLIFTELTPAKNNYVDEFNRGTVFFNLSKGINIYGREVFTASNYSYHKVIIPDGTIVNEVNFTQKEPHTNAITGKFLHFVDCNLVNVEIDPTWTFDNCTMFHKRERTENINGIKYIITEIDKKGNWEEVDREEIIN